MPDLFKDPDFNPDPKIMDRILGHKKRSAKINRSSSEHGGIRTPNLHGRNVVHYPVMLRVLFPERRCKYK